METISTKGISEGNRTEYYTVSFPTINNVGNVLGVDNKARCTDIAVSYSNSIYTQNSISERYKVAILTPARGGRISTQRFMSIVYHMFQYLYEIGKEDSVYFKLSDNKTRLLMTYSNKLGTAQMYIIYKAIRMFWDSSMDRSWTEAVEMFFSYHDDEDPDVRLVKIRGSNYKSVINYMKQFKEGPGQFLSSL